MARVSRGKGVALAVLLSLLPLWVVSSSIRSAGGFVFLAGVVFLTAGGIAFHLGWRRPLFALWLGLGLASLLTVTLEAVLWLAPGLLTGSIANFAYEGYHVLPGGIYRRDSHMALELKPGFARTLYWNGHWWHHGTNAAGYRGPGLAQADVVFLGDSMIYGHGVENADTVPSRFAARSGLRVANLGQQGTCLIQMWLRLRRLGLGLQPRLVVVCSHPNDIAEGVSFYGLDELERFIARPVEDEAEPLVMPWYRPRPRWDWKHYWNDHLALALRTAGALEGLGRAIHTRWSGSGPRSQDGSESPWEKAHGVPSVSYLQSPFSPEAPGASPEQRLGWQAHCQALAKIKYLCERQGARLVMLDLGYPHAFSQAIEAEARRLGVVYSPVGRVVLARALEGEDIYLAQDGHWSARGSDAVAAELLKCVTEAGLR